jgi:hypothetical protein
VTEEVEVFPPIPHFDTFSKHSTNKVVDERKGYEWREEREGGVRCGKKRGKKSVVSSEEGLWVKRGDEGCEKREERIVITYYWIYLKKHQLKQAD